MPLQPRQCGRIDIYLNSFTESHFLIDLTILSAKMEKVIRPKIFTKVLVNSLSYLIFHYNFTF